MITYRSHVNFLTMTAVAKAASLCKTLAYCALPPYNTVTTIDDARQVAAELRRAVDELRAALPDEVRNASNGNLSRHLAFIRRNLDNNIPMGCIGDAVDIAERDLPAVLQAFDAWCDKQSPQDAEISNQLAPYISDGQLNAAIRELWVVFKSRMVTAFDLDSYLDGHRLANALFGPSGATVRVLSNSDREGYLNLFKGLYTLSRNPVAHNDLPPNPAETEAVIALVSSAMVKIENARAAVAASNASS